MFWCATQNERSSHGPHRILRVPLGSEYIHAHLAGMPERRQKGSSGAAVDDTMVIPQCWVAAAGAHKRRRVDVHGKLTCARNPLCGIICALA